MANGSIWYHVRRRFPVYFWPVFAAGLIFVDWNHTRQWKASGKKSVLDKEIFGKDQ